MDFQQILATLVLILLLGLGHWWPWSALLGSKLHPIGAYTYGVSSILIAFLIYHWPSYHIVLELFVLCIVGGITVCLCYLIDWQASEISQKRREQKHNAKVVER
jgi:uncharacterized membrane protein YhaH (DUF805 family)